MAPPCAPAERPLRVLVVDPSPTAGRLVRACDPAEMPMEISHVRSLAAARSYLAHKPTDVAVITLELPDGSGLSLHESINRRYRRVDSIMLSHEPTVDAAMQAMRQGAADLMRKPIDPEALTDRLRAVIADRRKQREQTERVRRLRRACRKLDDARHEVSEQIDVLCEDLVVAYQDLADQMQHAVNRREFEAVIRDELDLQPLLRKTLQFLMEKAGPTNAAVFLPAMAEDEYSLGGYVNYDCDTGAADMLLQHLADVVAPRVAETDEILHLTDEEALAKWIGDDAAYLADCEVIAFGCRQEDESLAALVMFRDRSESFDDATLQACHAVRELLGERLVKLIRIHHRMAVDHPFHSDEAE